MILAKPTIHVRKRYARLVLYVLALLLIGLSFDSNADVPSIQMLDHVDAVFKPLQNTWYKAIRGYAEKLFWLLVLVDFSWTAVIYALEKNDMTEIIVSLVKKFFTIGFFFALLKLSDSWIPAIINSFRQIGTSVGSVSSVTPDGIVSTGFELAKGAFKIMKDLGMVEAFVVVLPVTIIAIIIYIAFLFVAVQLLVALIESYIAVGAGVILLGFGGSRWTTDSATKYVQYAVGTGLKLMILYLVVGTGQTLFDLLMLDPNNLLETCLVALGSALMYGFLAIQIPQIASSMMSGSPSLTAGALAGTAITMGAAIAGAGAATAATVAAAGSGGAGAAAGATGLAKALGAGYNSALDVGKTGIAAGAHAVSEVAKQGFGLATGAIGDAVNRGQTAFSEKVDASTGGKIASGIEASRGGSMSGAAPSGGNNAGGGAAGTRAAAPAASSASADKAMSSNSAAMQTGNSPASTSGGGSSVAGGAVPPPSGSSLGDASTASIEGGRSSGNSDSGNGSSGRDPIHERMQALQGYVPQDMAQGSAIHIDLKHTQD